MEISHGVCIYGSSKNSQLLMISSFVRRGRLLIISASVRGEITSAACLAMIRIAQMVTEELNLVAPTGAQQKIWHMPMIAGDQP